MYCEFYGLRERPFNVTSDPKFLYLNACYREALASLHYGVSQRKGFITLIGEAGTGKTTLLKRLLDDLDESTRTVFIFNTNVSFDEILEYIFHEFDLPVGDGRRLPMLQRLNGFLLEELRQGRNVALLIDEAQDLDFSVLEDLRLLSNLETAKEKILQIVLSGQPELAQKLANPGLRQLRQRVAINCRLMPLSKGEVARYIEARLAAAGAPGAGLFTPAAVERIFDISRGIPRLVNVICDNALVIGYAAGQRRIGADAVSEAAADLLANEVYREPHEQDAEPRPRGRRVRPARAQRRWSLPSQVPMVAGAVLVVVFGLLSAGRSWLRWDLTAPPVERVPRAPLEVVPPAAKLGLDVASRRGEAGEMRAAAALPRRSPEEPAAAAALPPGRGPAPWEEPLQTAAAGAAARDLGAPLSPPQAPLPEAGAAGAAISPTSESPGPRGAGTSAVVAEPPAGFAAGAREAGPAAVPRRPVKDTGGPAPGAAHETGPERPLPAEEAPSPGGAVVEPAPAEAPRARAAERPAEAPQVARAVSRAAGEPEMFDIDELPGLAGAVARRAAPARYVLSVSRYEEVVARPGDTLSKIAARRYGQATTTILDMVNLANPMIRDVDRIAAGQSIRLPRLDEGVALLRSASGAHALLVFSSLDRSRANRLRAALAGAGFPARVDAGPFGAGRTVYRVLVPGAGDRESALALGRRLKELLQGDDRIAALARAAGD